MQDKYGFQIEVIKNAKLDEIEAKLKQYMNAYQNGQFAEEGQLLIFFAGHGVKEYSNGYFLPADADPERIPRTGFAYSIWRPFISKLQCKHILVAVDACYSVTLDPDWQTMNGRSDFRRPGKGLSTVDFLLANHRKYPSRLFLTSDAKEDVVPGRSDFASKILEGLAEFKDSILTARELFAGWVKKANPTPNAGDFEGDDVRSSFLFFSQDFQGSTRGNSTPDTFPVDPKPVMVKLSVDANFSEATFTLDGQELYPITNTPTVKVFEIEYLGKPRKLEVWANDRICTKMIVVPSSYTDNSPPLQLICSQ